MTAQTGQGKGDKKRRQVLITYNDGDVDPNVELWLSNQKNKSKSLLFLISQIASTYGTDDILDIALTNVKMFDNNKD